MKISTKGRYALRLMVDLALNESGDPIKLKDIAGRQSISEKYLEQIIAMLNKADYVQSIRGAKGGYVLAKKPEEYTVGMILRLIEGSLSPVDCISQDNDCTRSTKCVTARVWKKIDTAISEVVDNITLQDLVDWHHEGENQEWVAWYI